MYCGEEVLQGRSVARKKEVEGRKGCKQQRSVYDKVYHDEENLMNLRCHNTLEESEETVTG